MSEGNQHTPPGQRDFGALFTTYVDQLKVVQQAVRDQAGRNVNLGMMVVGALLIVVSLSKLLNQLVLSTMVVLFIAGVLLIALAAWHQLNLSRTEQSVNEQIQEAGMLMFRQLHRPPAGQSQTTPLQELTKQAKDEAEGVRTALEAALVQAKEASMAAQAAQQAAEQAKAEADKVAAATDKEKQIEVAKEKAKEAMEKAGQAKKKAAEAEKQAQAAHLKAALTQRVIRQAIGKAIEAKAATDAVDEKATGAHEKTGEAAQGAKAAGEAEDASATAAKAVTDAAEAALVQKAVEAVTAATNAAQVAAKALQQVQAAQDATDEAITAAGIATTVVA